MGYQDDVAVLAKIVQETDPSFGTVDGAQIDRVLADLIHSAKTDDLHRVMFRMMALMALPRNGHSRIIPNDAIDVLPIRFVALGRGIYVTDCTSDLRIALDHRVIAVNGVAVEDILSAGQPYLAGTDMRRRVVGAILLAWPEAVAILIGQENGPVCTYDLMSPSGVVTQLQVSTTLRAPATHYYPISEHGGAHAHRDLTNLAKVVHMPTSGCLHVQLPSFFCPSSKKMEAELKGASYAIGQQPNARLIFDVRGNTGGDFLRTRPFLHDIQKTWKGREYVVLVDKFTFSAAIVFVAILTTTLSGCRGIIGETMGDNTQFYAEGESITLPQSGCVLRYSSAYHDWKTGRAEVTTPKDIIPHLVAAGTLDPDVSVDMTATDLRAGHDPSLQAALQRLSQQ